MTNEDLRQANKRRLETLKNSKKEIISFNEIQKFIDDLSKQTEGKYTGVYGVPRGGLILAVMYSYRNNIPLLLAPQKGCLVIDDDIGTGLTINPYIGKYDVAVMYSNEDCSVKPTYLHAYYDDSVYKVFAWNEWEDLRW